MNKRLGQVLLACGIMMMTASPLVVRAANISVDFGQSSTPEGLSSSLQLLIFLTFLTLLPSIVLTMTSFTRIIIIFSMLRNGLGTQSTPPNQVLVGLALFLTFFIMSPILSDINEEAIQPYMEGQISEETFIEEVQTPLRQFLLSHTRNKDLELFVEVSGIEAPQDADSLPLHVIVPAFIISELKTAFEIGFLLFLPFIVIDFVVSSVLMSMGMFMLPPAMISLPFKILLFVMIDGWHLVVESIVKSFMR